MAYQECWLKDRCNGIDCDKSICVKRFKLDSLFEQTKLPEKYKRDIKLRVDEDKGDLENFNYLKSISTAVEKFVSSGDNFSESIHTP